MRLLFDTESNGLLDDATKIHGAAAVDVDTGNGLDWRPGDKTYLTSLDAADVLIGHNILRHDLPLIEKLEGWKPKSSVKIIDTFICARVMYPNIKETDFKLVLQGKMPPGKEFQGKHSLAAWGYRLGEAKGDYAKIMELRARDAGLTEEKDILRYVWGEWSELMHEYMIQDVQTNLALWNFLKVDRYSPKCIELEHRITRVTDLMEQAGVPFNEAGAAELQAELIDAKSKIETKLVETFGSWEAPISPDPKKATFVPKRDNAKLGYKKGVPVLKMKTVTFNPRSRDHIAKVLQDRDWTPSKKKMTDGGKPKIDEEVVADVIVRYPELAGLGEYLMLEKRLSQLATGKQAWMNHVDHGYIHGAINPAGTQTGRASHFNPNLGQVPNLASPYGRECRSLFYAPSGWRMVGADQSGLELRGLAHYLHPLDGGNYAHTVLEGDPHWAHAVAMGLANGPRDKENRLHKIIREDGSKRFIYAYIYGCGNEKAGEIIHTCLLKARQECGSEGEALYREFFPNGYSEDDAVSVGKRIRNDFMRKIDGFAKLRRKIEDQVDTHGWVPGLDGRRIPVRSSHSALNFMIQSCGAVICKRWVCDAFDKMSATFNYNKEDPWAGEFVCGLWVHDEVQYWVREGLEKGTISILQETAKAAGLPFQFRVRLDGEAKVGNSWADTH